MGVFSRIGIPEAVRDVTAESARVILDE